MNVPILSLELDHVRQQMRVAIGQHMAELQKMIDEALVATLSPEHVASLVRQRVHAELDNVVRDAVQRALRHAVEDEVLKAVRQAAGDAASAALARLSAGNTP